MISELKGHTGSVHSVAWSPGGDQIVSGSEDTTAIVWDVSTGNRVSTLSCHTGQVLSVAWKGVLGRYDSNWISRQDSCCVEH